MSANYSFVGEINRNNAMSAVADTMNQLSLDILTATMEMGGKQVVQANGNAYALERLSAEEIKDLKTSTVSTTAEFTFAAVGVEAAYDVTLTKGLDGSYSGIDAGGAKILVYPSALVNNVQQWFSATGTVSSKTPDVGTHIISDEQVAQNIFNILGIVPDTDIDGKISKTENWSITLEADGDGVRMQVAYKDTATGNTMGMAVRLDANGKCVGFSELKVYKDKDPDEVSIDSEDIVAVDSTGLLESWGIKDPENLQPGDLFMIQQQLQIIKDLVSAIHTTGKTQGDIMREATQKFAQG